MVEKVSTKGGYVWAYLPDLSRRWGEMEARDSMIWIQPPGTPTMGHLFLDAYHATGDEYYYRPPRRSPARSIWAQHAVRRLELHRRLRRRSRRCASGTTPSARTPGASRSSSTTGAMPRSTTPARPRRRSFCCACTSRSAIRNTSRRSTRRIAFVIDSQYPIGAWPQRYPLQHEFSHHGKPDYTSFLTFNDDVGDGEHRLPAQVLPGARRSAGARPDHPRHERVHRHAAGAAAAGLGAAVHAGPEAVGARTYEPNALVTHTTAPNIELLIDVLPADRRDEVPGACRRGDRLARQPDAAAGVAPRGGRTHPTFIELGTNKPLYVHREGSNVVNGRYYVDYDPKNTLAHYSSFRERRRRRPAQAVRRGQGRVAGGAGASSRRWQPGAGLMPLPRFFAVDAGAKRLRGERRSRRSTATATGWRRSATTAIPTRATARRQSRRGTSRARTSATRPTRRRIPIRQLMGISIAAYIRNMSVLIRRAASRDAESA